MEAFAAAGWYESPGRGMVAVIGATEQFALQELQELYVGQQAVINGVLYTVKSVEPPEAGAPFDPAGRVFGLLV